MLITMCKAMQFKKKKSFLFRIVFSSFFEKNKIIIIISISNAKKQIMKLPIILCSLSRRCARAVD